VYPNGWSDLPAATAAIACDRGPLHHRLPLTLTNTMKWLLTTFLALLVLTALQPWLQRLGIGRLPGDLRFRRNGREVVLPFTSTVVLSLLLMLIARLF
jgi:hypothetical protein